VTSGTAGGRKASDGCARATAGTIARSHKTAAHTADGWYWPGIVSLLKLGIG
jgi:hypothetical protein